MEPGRTTLLTRTEFEQASMSASNKLISLAEWFDEDGKKHRDGDLPAVLHSEGSQFWYRHGKKHRDGDLPAYLWGDGSQGWCQNGNFHRGDDLPAIVWANGDQEWRQHGKRHRANGLPTIECKNGVKIWYRHDKLHRDGNLPAIIYVKGSNRHQNHTYLLESIIDIEGAMEWYVDGVKTGDQNSPPPGAVFPGQLTKNASKW